MVTVIPPSLNMKANFDPTVLSTCIPAWSPDGKEVFTDHHYPLTISHPNIYPGFDTLSIWKTGSVKYDKYKMLLETVDMFAS